MKKSEIAIRAAFVGLIGTGLAAASQTALAAKGDNEKCYGIVKAGKNDCGSATRSCAGTASKDGEKDAWIYLPKGTCEKIVGGSLTEGMDSKADKGGKK